MIPGKYRIGTNKRPNFKVVEFDHLNQRMACQVLSAAFLNGLRELVIRIDVVQLLNKKSCSKIRLNHLPVFLPIFVNLARTKAITFMDILAEWANGNTAALKQLFRLHYPSLCSFAEKLTGERQEAEDIVAEVFIRLWKQYPVFSSLDKIKAFLYISTRNACLDILKSRKRRNQHKQAFQQLMGSDMVSDEAFAEAELHHTLVLQLLYEEIENLPDRCREVFKLSYLQGMKNDAIAGKLGVSYDTVRTQKQRALQYLRSALLKKGLLPAFYFLLVTYK